MSNKLKYPLYLFFAVLSAKFAYILVESFYNYHVLITTTSIDVSRETLEDINKTGHHISAAGITLLLIPIFYLFIKRLSEKKIYIFTSFFAIIMYISSYNLLNVAIDYIVKVNKEERHNAYYVNIFKYGLLNSAFYYDDFIHRDKIKNNDISIEDRILLTNSFILLYADENLIDKLKKRGKEALANKYLNNNEEYHKNFEQFKKLTKDITKLWNEFNNGRNKLAIEKNKVIKLNSKEAYDSFKNELKQSYKDYISLWKEIDERTKASIIDETYNQLRRYFRNKGYSRAESIYKEKMIKEFGRYIDPNMWLDDNGKLTKSSVKKFIKKEIFKKVGNNLEDVPRGLSAGGFFNNPFIKINVAKKLKSKGILVTKDFDYSYKKFKISYDKFTSLKFQKAIEFFYNELENKIGKNDLKIEDEWNDFVHSEYLKNQIRSKIKFNDKSELSTLLKVIESKDLNNFREMIYLPKAVAEVERRMFTREEFLTNEKAIKYGDDAIRLLYVPAFALAVSIIALLLNFVTVIGMGLEYTKKLTSFRILLIKILILVLILLLPFIMGYNGFDNEFISLVSSEKLESYFNFLNWIGYYENINAALH